MKRLQEKDPYPSELWENTPAPSWSPERVWAQIEAEPSRQAHRSWRWLTLCLLTLSIGSVRWVSQEVRLATEQASVKESIQKVREIEPNIDPVVPKEEKVLEFQPKEKWDDTTVKTIPLRVAPAKNGESIVTPQDTVDALRPIPIADLQLPASTPLLPQDSIITLPETITALPPEVRPGSKLILKIPEIPAAEVRQGAFVKRLWQQYKRLNTEGEVDWLELGIQPNGDGTFSILPPAKKTAIKPN